MHATEQLEPAAARRARLEERFTPWRSMTLPAALDRAVAEYADRPLVITDARTYTYADIQDWSRQLAAGLVSLGVKPGDRVAMVMANHPEFVAAKFAIARTGATCIPVNFLFRAAELGYVLAQSETSVLITMDRYRDLDYLGAIDGLMPGWERDGGGASLPNLRHVVMFSPDGVVRDGAHTIASLATYGDDAARATLEANERVIEPGSYSDILYTSGTTGSPKGVQLTHEQVVRVAYGAAYQRALEDGRRIGFPLPMYHVFGYVECLMASLYVGGAIVPEVAFEADTMLRSIETHRVNEIVAVPAVTLPLLDAARAGSYDLSSVHTVFSSGGAVPPTIWDDIRTVFGPVALTTGYGMTETTAATSCAMPEGEIDHLRTSLGCLRYAGAAGDPELGGYLAVYRAIDSATGEDVPPGEIGHLLVRGPGVTHGYYKKPEETRLAFTDDGWLLTGDLGSIDADGYIRLTGRLKETFRTGGEMVMPAEIEAVLQEHPSVRQAQVVGIPHDRMGEIALAWIVPEDPESPPEADTLIAHCSDRLARFKVPRKYLITSTDEIPLTATGRVQKFKLRELALARLESRSTAAA